MFMIKLKTATVLLKFLWSIAMTQPFRRLLVNLSVTTLFSLLGNGHLSRARADLPPLVPREVLFGPSDRGNPALSPDGKHLAWLGRDQKNVQQVWVKTIGKDDERIVTADKKRGIPYFFWAENSKVLLYVQDNNGDENYHLYGVDLASGTIRDFTPQEGVSVLTMRSNPSFPDDILIRLNARDERFHDVYRLNVITGDLTLDTKNPGGFFNFIPDSSYQVRAAHVVTPDGGTEIRVRDQAEAEWTGWLKAGPGEILALLDFTADGQAALVASTVGSETARLVERNFATGAEKVIASSDEVDLCDVVFHPTKHTVQAVSFAPGRNRWAVIDPSIKEDFEGIAKLHDGDFGIISRDRADRTWLVRFDTDRGPNHYYTWDSAAQRGTFMFVNKAALKNVKLCAMEPVIIKSRDGLNLHSYLTLPAGVPAEKLPMVLLVHGGPRSRDFWGYRREVQWLANRGYACLQVNFRGSRGYGKKFLDAGNKQWGLKMQDDLLDAVAWAIEKGIADPKKVAIYGSSYGGYAALAGTAFTPEVFACTVDVCGPSNLRTLISNYPAYWKPHRALDDATIGNIDDPKDAELLRNASPLFKADKIVRPLLIGQGAHDVRVTQSESDQIVAAIEKSGGNVTYVLYPDEGHVFERPENIIDFNARIEAFLAEYLGGRAEPIVGDRYPGSTPVVRVIGK